MSEQQATSGRARGATVAGEVVAGLVNDGSAAEVARAAVRLAAAHECRVRFVEVRTVHSHEDAGAATFGIALRAARGQGAPIVFEVISGHPGRRLVERSAGAAALVVGRHRAGGSSGTADYCRAHARCPVLAPAGQTDPAPTEMSTTKEQP